MGEGDILVAASEIGKNGAVSQDSSCNCEVSGGYIAAEQDSLVRVRPTSGISHGAL